MHENVALVQVSLGETFFYFGLAGIAVLKTLSGGLRGSQRCIHVGRRVSTHTSDPSHDAAEGPTAICCWKSIRRPCWGGVGGSANLNDVADTVNKV